MAKLNKQQTLELIQSIVSNTINQNIELFKKGKAEMLETMLNEEMETNFKPKRGGSSVKVNAEGEVYCNYYKEYYPAEDFNTKLSKPNKITGERKEGYKANCKMAELVLRKIKALKLKVTKQVTAEFRAGHMTAEKLNELLDKVDDVSNNTYYSPEEVPTVADIVGLNGSDTKPVREK